MSNIKVDFGALEGLSGGIDSQSKAIQGQLDNLGNQIKKLEGIWEGSANEGFQAQKTQWFTAAESLRATLAKIAVAVKTANENYSSTEGANAKRFGG
ncbi:WXG100 family type VII secretion target [Tamaricihabitans halophyticus]|uniref:ESAT-6-like protein n=1 Tax=Tamaricihabitans halophyticus TaxID=1262583 RepID=A0A4R2R1F3_9PSEU|nr:WXG100 family type VII secretion target [Tamaricihabitans halophyticus]TCP53245.1 WXG100 family type VII secretion target [Tamaricihabitans halophyticus]